MQNSFQLTDGNVLNLYHTEKHNQNYEAELSFSVKSKNSCSISLIQFILIVVVHKKIYIFNYNWKSFGRMFQSLGIC